MSQRLQEENAREKLAELARSLHRQERLVAGLGSLSLRLERGGLLVTPPQKTARQLLAGDLLLFESASTSEPEHVALHRLAYAARPEAGVVGLLQLSAVAAVTMAGVDVARCLLDGELAGLGRVSWGEASPQDELSAALRAALTVAPDVLLERFGVLVAAAELDALELRVERLEHAARVTQQARTLARAAATSEQQLARLAAGLRDYGLRVGPECARCNACSLGARHHGGDEAFGAHVDAAVAAHLSRLG